MEKRNTVFLAIVVCFAASLTGIDTAYAIPAFSRQYNAACKTCHTVFPERNEFGEAFEKNSFVWPRRLTEEEKVRAKSILGDSSISAFLHPEMPTVLPVSINAQHDIAYNSNDKPQLNLDAGTEIEVFAAGAFRDKAGFWAEHNLTEKETGEVYVQFRNPLELPVNVKIGKFLPHLSLWKPNDSATISPFGYNELKVKEGVDQFSMDSTQGAVELNAIIGHRLFAATGVTNGFNTKTNGKDYYGHLSARLSGTNFLGDDPYVDFGVDSIWDFLTITVGGFGYVGSSNESTNDFYRAGLESEFMYRAYKLRLSGILGKDNNPNGDNLSIKTQTLLTEAQYLVGTQALAAMRFEYESTENNNTVRRYIPTIAYTPYQNVRLAVEYKHEIKSDITNRGATLRLTFVF